MIRAEELPEIDPGEIDQLLQQNLDVVLVLVGVLIGSYLIAPWLVRRAVRTSLKGQAADLREGGVAAVEVDKRARTMERLATTLIRAAILFVLVYLFIALFGLWSVLAGVGIFLAALALAGQSIVLDYLMGIFIVVEGTYFEGDNIATGDPGWEVLGVVETVGLRRTVIRGPDGTVHSVSNGLMRQVSNRTRVYAAAEVHVRGIREEDLDRVMARSGGLDLGLPRRTSSQTRSLSRIR